MKLNEKECELVRTVVDRVAGSWESMDKQVYRDIGKGVRRALDCIGHDGLITQPAAVKAVADVLQSDIEIATMMGADAKALRERVELYSRCAAELGPTGKKERS